jgi:predicted regulator of Ras-like GTPase activity (Roadblock/LC7/MglB family)
MPLARTAPLCQPATATALAGFQTMLDTLKSIVDKIPGAKAAVLMGLDGYAVEKYVGNGDLGDIEQVATEFIEMVKVARALDLGTVTDITIKAERGTLLARFLSEGYFAVVLMSDTGNFGKGRWVLRTAANELLASL